MNVCGWLMRLTRSTTAAPSRRTSTTALSSALKKLRSDSLNQQNPRHSSPSQKMGLNGPRASAAGRAPTDLMLPQRLPGQV